MEIFASIRKVKTKQRDAKQRVGLVHHFNLNQTQPSKQDILVQCWHKVWPLSETLVRHFSSTGSMFGVFPCDLREGNDTRLSAVQRQNAVSAQFTSHYILLLPLQISGDGTVLKLSAC